MILGGSWIVMCSCPTLFLRLGSQYGPWDPYIPCCIPDAYPKGAIWVHIGAYLEPRGILCGSWVVISGVISPLIWAITIVVLLATTLALPSIIVYAIVYLLYHRQYTNIVSQHVLYIHEI